ILDAIDAYTINGARMMQQDDITGSLEAGKKADFIILDRDIIALANQGRADEISDTLVLETWFNGRPVYRQGEKMKKWGQIE
ncbi:MAG: amidohydrolase family protein, partial [Halioglobus sp.]|nr:amidohydrolase family protein [Halioglobus sp.]